MEWNEKLKNWLSDMETNKKTSDGKSFILFDFVLGLAFLADTRALLNEFNIELQGK